MTYFHTCVGCKRRDDCPIKAKLRASIKGLGLTSLKHRCRERADMFTNGDPVLVRTYSGHNEEDEGIYDDFPGHFIRQRGSKALVIVKPGSAGADDCHGYYPFKPKNESGFLSIPLARISANPDGVRTSMQECHRCGSIASIMGENTRCNESDRWHPMCLFKASAQCPIEERSDNTSPVTQEPT